MKLLHISIHNFRGIIDASMDFQSYALLVGANNSGKSTIIDCIRAFYEKDGFKFKKESDFPLKGARDKESWIELEFSLNDEEYNSLKNEYKTPEKTLKVRKYFCTENKFPKNKNANGIIRGYKSDGTLSDDAFYGARNVQSGKFGDLVYIPAISKIDEHTKLTGPSALRDLLTSVMSDVVEGSSAYKGLSHSVDQFAREVRKMKTQDNRSLSSFENDLNTKLASWETKFNLKFTTPSMPEIIKSMLRYEFQDDHHDKPQNVEHFGSGFQRNFIYSLIQLRTEYAPQKAIKKSKDFTPSLNLVLFEEPEAFLHPPKQNDLARNLIKISKDENWQIVCSTHSSNFVSRNTDLISAVIRIYRERGIVKTFQINNERWNNIVDNNRNIAQITHQYPRRLGMREDDLQAEMDAVKYCLWLNPDRSSMFFAENVLLVEGPSETALINRLLDDERLSLPPGTYILDCLGKYNIHRFMNIMNALGIFHSVLHDDDDKREHQALNQLIQNSKGDFTHSISTIPKDIEAVLGVSHIQQPHRKPQHLMYKYVNNQMDQQKLSDFCSRVQSCFERTESQD